MCASGLYELGISKIVYAAANERFGGICSVGSCSKYNREKAGVEVVRRFIIIIGMFEVPFFVVEGCRQHGRDSDRNRDVMYYVVSIGVVAIGVTFAAIPAYRIFCEKTSFGGLTQIAKDFERIAKMKKVEDRLIRVQFNSDVPSSMRWEFKPQQHEMYVHPGETALAFYTARNPTDRPIVGISSYNLTPFQAAYYFNKIQCFCFEEQILNPGEQVDLPVFFYIDPDYANDPALEYLDNILLSYTFFEAKSDLQLPSPFDPNNRPTLFFYSTVVQLIGDVSVPFCIHVYRVLTTMTNRRASKRPAVKETNSHGRAVKKAPVLKENGRTEQSNAAVFCDATNRSCVGGSGDHPGSLHVPQFLRNFFTHAERLCRDAPCSSFEKLASCRLVGLFDALSGRLCGLEDDQLRLHYRYATDLPEMQTIIVCNRGRYCLWRDVPNSEEGWIVHVPNDDRFPKIELIGNRVEHAVVHLAGKSDMDPREFLPEPADVAAVKQQMKSACALRSKKKVCLHTLQSNWPHSFLLASALTTFTL
ncbi:cytochrome c oxidase assembly protein CtaG / Cox11 [Ancylostoma caninum]|uniref:Cytochrome c oxidase assembly protein COX11, mitochondrial n=1 Tax=Ancylostoma caninum TaxID=29170 RepID=A0A368GRP2_ANCCA|nr:cytochrome c oxidase assembly protein CtaG / Cox11 [Ancylostoma caninum]